jgi:hypothetical protein
MKTYISILFLLLFAATVSAQTAQPNKIVYLKDGSNVKGTVTVNDSSGFVMVVDRYNEYHYYQKNMVAKIDDIALHQPSYNLKTHGYVCNIELGGTDVLAKDNGNNISTFSLNVVNSYLFSPYVSLGMGIGTELSGSFENLEMLSLYADSRIYFIRSNISPYMNLGFGYTGMFQKYTYYNNFDGSSDVAKDGDHGMMFSPALGIRVAVGKATALTASLGYKFYYLHNNGQYYTVSNDNTFRPNGNSFYLFNSISIRAGFQF